MSKREFTTERTGDWIATFTGLRFFVTDPHPEDVVLADIAHALSLICRFGGHCREFYSVAQHSVEVAKAVMAAHPHSPALALWALLHDATEAYLGDMVRPLKLSMPAYKELEKRTEAVICAHFGIVLTEEKHDLVKHFDDVLLMTERRDLVNHCGIEWTPRAEPLNERLQPMPPDCAELEFSRLYFRLAGNMAEVAS